MPLWDRLRDLGLAVEELKTERLSVDVSTQFTRVTTTVVLAGAAWTGQIGLPWSARLVQIQSSYLPTTDECVN